ncbi:spermidine synthase [Sphaerisporangium album]|uniref:Polyamine aminopropyltransferase n=1 Tax=Sphaerisporangium album TaxID=509200 RepID=A0A367ESV9_9ACTN|nr:spermidine synthase [Sphaerisporangium album]RCG21174.1 spermidine synthase [Sphaerisporangium album]
MESFDEPLGQGLWRRWQVHDVLFRGATSYQDVLIAVTEHGVTLFCDGERQSSELSQLTYHEALMVPALLMCSRPPEQVLIVGSSEGVASRIAVESGALLVDHVDIDAQCVQLCAEHLPYGYTSAELVAACTGQGPVTVHYQDGHAWVERALREDRRYDLIVIDLPDEQPDAPAQHNRLYDTPYLQMCRDLLTSTGVLAIQAGCPTLWRNDTLAASVNRLQQVFSSTGFYACYEHEWAFAFGLAETGPLDVIARFNRLPDLPYQPSTLDLASLVSGAVLPYHVRSRLSPAW